MLNGLKCKSEGTNLEEYVFTEEEAINITKHYGYDGSEFMKAVWKKRGCLHPNRTMDSLIRKLETIYHNVEVEGKGKKRRYILTDKKDEMTELKYNYKGTVPTKEEETIKEYFYNCLVEKNREVANTYNKWGEEFNLLQPKTFSNEMLIEKVKELHHGLFYNPNEIVSEFINAIRNHNYALVHNSFNRLEQEGKISQSSVYIFKTTEGKHEIVSKDEYEDAIAYKKDCVQELGIDYRHYILSYRSFHKNKQMENVIKKVDEQMAETFNIHYMYEMIKVKVENSKSQYEYSIQEFEQAYFNKFVQLSKNRQNREDYKNTNSFWRRTYLLNTLTLLSLILKGRKEFNWLEDLTSVEMKRISEDEFFDYTLREQELDN